MRKFKNLVAILLVVAMLVAGISLVPSTAKADGTLNIPTTVDYDNGYEIAKYWKEDVKTAPVKDGYVFGGWYKKMAENSYEAITEENLKENDVGEYEGAYAKFVPAYVLSVRMQLAKETEENNGGGTNTYLRVISAVDSTSYQNVGFELLYGKKIKDEKVLSNVYKNIENAEASINVKDVFGNPAEYFSVLKISGIGSQNYGSVIYVKPFWTTMDGTKVEGLSKYVRVMDGYAENQYISVPVNLSEGSDVAAGKLQMKYDQTKLQYVGFDSGVILPEMEVKANDSTGRINFVGNGSDTDKLVNPASGIYANVWFKKTTSDMGRLQFDVKNLEFCTWEPAMVDNVKAWDIQY